MKCLMAFPCILLALLVDVSEESVDYISWAHSQKRTEASEYFIENDLYGKQVRMIGYFLAAHKYFEVDRRYTFKTTIFEDKKFFKYFPVPRLRKLHPAVQLACDEGILPCIREVGGTANISGSLQNLRKEKKKIHYFYPFKSGLELFRYRTTASYYFCWYADRKAPPLGIPGTDDCFKDLHKVFETKGIFRKKIIEDFRSRMNKPKKDIAYPFLCSYLWFCPDPCYGKLTGGRVKSRASSLKEKSNPCRGQKNPLCTWDRGRNQNFEDLIKNRINYSCVCNDRTYKWNARFRMCVDTDECYEGKAECPEGKICRNTVGSYECTCRRGYVNNKTSGTCQRHSLLSSAASRGLKNRGKLKTKDVEPSEFWTFMDFIFGFSNNSGKTEVFTLHLVTGLMVVYLIWNCIS